MPVLFEFKRLVVAAKQSNVRERCSGCLESVERQARSRLSMTHIRIVALIARHKHCHLLESVVPFPFLSALSFT